MWIYTGEGAFFPGIPARNLTDEEGTDHGVADLQGGIYEHVEGNISEAPAIEDPESEGDE